MSTITTVEASNSLADLAARIRQEHEASLAAIKRGLGHAISAGTLLLEAKSQLKHGQWLPWLREHCAIPERTARDYMHLARHAADPEAKSAISADLNGAIKVLVAPDPPDADSDFDDMLDWATWQLEGPFRGWDFDDAGGQDWIETKLMHHVKLPVLASWCFSVSDGTGRVPLRLCPWDELVEATKALAPIAGEGRALPFDSESFDSMQAMGSAIWEIGIRAKWMLGNLLYEMEYREKLDDECYARERDETHQKVMACLDAKLAELRRSRAVGDPPEAA